MNDSQVKPRMDIESRIKEAEVYHSMELIDESLSIYEEMLAEAPDLHPQAMESIKKKIEILKKKQRHHGKKYAREISPEELCVIKEALSVREHSSWRQKRPSPTPIISRTP